MIIETERLTLYSCDSTLLDQALADDHTELQNTLKVSAETGWKDWHGASFRQVKERLQDCAEERGWWTYFAIYKSEQRLIGSCGFKGRPGEDGIVEIAYEVASSYRGRGLAKEMAVGLINYAFESGFVVAVQAYTLGKNNASTTILTQCGFKKIDEIDDPDDGLLWLWNLTQKDFTPLPANSSATVALGRSA